MLSIYQFKDFRDYLRAHLATLPKAGYGQSRKLAAHLEVHTTLVSQVLKGTKAFTLEQASKVCEFLSLSETETDYFLLLVQLDRAGSVSLRKNLLRQLASLQARAQELSNRLSAKGKLTEENRGIFYSDWIYSAARQVTAIEGYDNLDAIAEYFGLSKKRIKQVVEFLLAVGLCREDKGRLRVGPTSTHIESTAEWVRLHHLNWRHKAIEAINKDGLARLHYTAPMTMSRADAETIREMIAKFLESIDKVVEPSPSESLHCLNIDWFEVTK